ncbi:MAG: ATP-dependent zinc protease [Oleibacter sp.]|nr:ATP-dependent zinc protease [Thalassolituus sp.]
MSDCRSAMRLIGSFSVMKRVIISLFVFLCITLLAACSHWPTPDHRAVTLSEIDTLLIERCAADPNVQSSLEQIGRAADSQSIELSSLKAEVSVLADQNFVLQQQLEQKPRECPPTKVRSIPYREGKVIVGSKEWIYLSPPGKHFSARVDTGAATSSISAENIVRFERNGDRWVSFDVHLDNGDLLPMEAPLTRNVRIRQASYEDLDRRPVVELDVSLGNVLRQPTEFTLADRTRMSFPVLLGRAFLRDLVLVDVGAEFLHPKTDPTQEITKP